MRQSTTIEPVAQITTAPMVNLVTLDGYAVPDCERHTPTCDREPCPADSWPAWTDLVVVRLGGRRPFEHRIGATILGDAYQAVMERADGGQDDPDDEAGIFGINEPLPALPDLRDPHDWPAEGPDGVDGDPAIAFPGIAPLAERLALPPICGGSDEAQPYEPTAEDWADYRAWCAEVESRAALARLEHVRNPMWGYE